MSQRRIQITNSPMNLSAQARSTHERTCVSVPLINFLIKMICGGAPSHPMMSYIRKVGIIGHGNKLIGRRRVGAAKIILRGFVFCQDSCGQFSGRPQREPARIGRSCEVHNYIGVE